MWGFTGVAGHRALSAGTLLIAGGGLALYQMTSLVLGPGGSRELHVSLTVPSVDPDERTESWTNNNLALGTLAGPAPAAPVWARSTVTHRAPSRPAGYRAPAPVRPVAAQPPTTQPGTPPVPPIVVLPDLQPGAHQGDDTA